MANSIELSDSNVGKTLLRLAIPTILAQFANLLYNVVDRIYIGRLPDGAMAIAGIGITAPIIMLITAFCSLIGAGGAPQAAIYMGKGENSRAEKVLGNCLSLLIIISITLTIVFSIFKEAILWQIGASEVTISYAFDYLRVYLLGTIFVQLTLGLNPFINTQGFTKVGMMSTVIGAVANLILDPIFIFLLRMGVRGAALATVLSQLIAMLWILRFLFGKKTVLKIKKANLKLDRSIVLSIVALGSAPFVMQTLEFVNILLLNRQLLRYGGDLALASMAIMVSLLQMLSLPLAGLAQGAQPILSFNYGAGNKGIVRGAFKLLLKCCLIYSSLYVTLLMIAPQNFVRIFNNDSALITATSSAIRIYFPGAFILGAQLACQQSLIALGKPKQSMLIVIIKKVFVFIPLLYIFPKLFTANQHYAVLAVYPVTDVFATVIAGICFFWVYKKYLTEAGDS